ncbi:GNAT family N-acetyltransferase [Ferrimonas futtsuensis]|uniref:GNAT family N-acetyltransferase n=1 Tax=Ferrimonas futtsuensis TaxID=364764 RepID=UPI001FE2426F|nr:GNAT family N-acetyltransferase [Ferrimonas futtsuensis]
MMLPLTTERLTIRELTLDDAPFYLKLLNEQAFIDGIHDKGVRTLEQARHHMESGPIASYQQHGYGMYHLSLTQSGADVGIAGLVKREELPYPDIGYAISEAYFGLGLATEACQAVMHHARETLALPTVVGIVSEHNLASRRVLQKLGMEADGTVELGAGEHVMLYRAAR